ncbi:MAG: CDP-glucose 4,6-dehydratase [Gammaproteobacteria bacterium]|nr:CDP-glucose 4,6-dehydratase [Gammaproteobacteria bacterium]
MNRDFWKGKRVLITGHTGFKGAWLSQWLHMAGAEVTGFALTPPSEPSLFDVISLNKRINSVIGDIRDLPSVLKVYADCRPEIVLHLAAQPLVRLSYREPIETYSTNVMGTLNCLEAARRTGGVRAFVVVTSDKCYENKEWEWGYRENEPMGGYDPYSSSKGCVELLTASYRNSYFPVSDWKKHGVAIASARAGNVIGGGDWAEDRLIPDMINCFMRNETVQIRNPNAIRPWQHVLEPLSGYLLLAEKLWCDGEVYAEGWNFGPSEYDAKPVSWIVDELVKSWGDGASWKLDGDYHPHEAHYLKLDSSKARSRLGWIPRWDIQQALDHSARWYKAYSQGEDMLSFTINQILAYEVKH